MSWTKNGPASATRPIAPREKAMKMFGTVSTAPDLEQQIIFSIVVLPESVTPERLAQLVPEFKEAWLTLRFEHPSIASTLSADGSVINYKSPITTELQDEWKERTFILDDTATTTEEMRTRLRDRANDSLTFAPRARAILLAQPHWKTDARAVMRLSGRYLVLCNQRISKLQTLAWGTELDRLVPSLAEIARLPTEPPPEEAAEMHEDALGCLKFGSPHGQELVADPTSPPAVSRTEHLLLSQDETSAIMKAARAHGFSFGSAVHAASAMLNLSLADPSCAQKEYKYSVHRDLRAHLPEPWNESMAGLMVTTYPASIPANSDFLTTARVMEQHGREALTPERFARDEAMWGRIVDIITGAVPDDLKPSQEFRPPLDVTLSSLGLVDDYFDATMEIAPERVEMGAQAYMTLASAWAYTYRGCLNLSMSYNDAYRTRESTCAYLREIMAILERELL